MSGYRFMADNILEPQGPSNHLWNHQVAIIMISSAETFFTWLPPNQVLNIDQFPNLAL